MANNPNRSNGATSRVHTNKGWLVRLGETPERHTGSKSGETSTPESLIEDSDNITEQAFNAEDAIKACEQSMDFLAITALPEMVEFGFPPFFVACWQLITSYAQRTKDFSRLALGIPRGHAKTTVLKLFVLYCILFTRKKFILVVCATETHSINILSDVVDMLDHPNIKSLFGDWRLGLENIDRQDLKKFGFRGRTIILAGLGVGGTLRGMNLHFERPDVIIFDDIQTKECSESVVQTQTLERWFYGTAMYSRSPKGCLYVLAGNMYPGPNCLLKKLKKNTSWVKFIGGGILADGSALWEDLQPISVLLTELDAAIEAGHPEIFFSEIMNDTEAGQNTSVDLSKIRPWKWADLDTPQGKFIIIDPATGKTGPRRDPTSIGYFEVYDGTPGLRDLVEEFLSPGNTILRTLILALRTGTRLIGCEATGYQSTLLYWFEKIVASRGLQQAGFVFVELHTRSISKNARIGSMLKGLTSSEIDVHTSVRSKVTDQIANWNPLRLDNNDGILDLLYYTTPMMQNYGHLCLTNEEELLQDADESHTGVIENNHAF